MSLVAASPASHQSEAIIRDYVNREFGHFVVATDDRVFINVLRRTIVTELGLPSNCMTVLTNHDPILKTVKEMSVRKKSVMVFIQTSMNNVKLEDIIKQIAWRISNSTVVIVTTEAELHHLALLREQKIADNWIIKPVVINQLLTKVATIIKPHGNLDKLIQGARQYLEQGAFRNVLIICKKIFETNPDSAVAYLYMGDAHRGLEQEEEMVRAYEQAGYLDEMFLDPTCRLVDFYRAKGDKEKELRFLEKLDALSPLNMERKMDIAKLHLELGHDDDANGTFDSVMKMTTKKMNDAVSQTALKIGSIYAAQGNPEAEKYYRKAIETYGAALNKSHIHLFNNLGIYLRKAGKLKEAIAEYKRALEIDPENEIIYYNLALAHNDRDEHGDANMCMRRAMRINPVFCKNDCVISYNAGMIFSKCGEMDEAIKYVKLSLSLNPEFDSAKTLMTTLMKHAPHANA